MTSAISGFGGSLVAPARASGLERVPGWVLLGTGVLLTLITGGRWNVALLAWVSVVPFLLFARRLTRVKQWLGLGGVLLLAITLQVAKLFTEPVSPALALLFGPPAALSLLLVLVATEWFRRRLGETSAVLGFASLTALLDLGSYAGTEFGAWTTSSTTQVGSVLVMQLASVVGLWGIGFLMGWVNALVAALLGAREPRRLLVHVAVAAVALATMLGWATLRAERVHGGELTVAAVTTDVGMTSSGLPGGAVLAANTDALFERSVLAASRGARLIVWPEAATVVQPAAEGALVARGQAFATRYRADLVLAYAVLVSIRPLQLDNKLAFITSEGEVADTYRKHHPVPSEPSIKGTDPLRVVTRPYAKVGVAICYDYDFPAVAREHARLGANLVVVPSSDWRGIDPVHTEMARVRAIEGGFSLVRAVRWATSGAFDAYGRVRGLLPGRESGKVLVAQVPLERVPTVYAAVGDTPAAGVGLLLLGLFVCARARAVRR